MTDPTSRALSLLSLPQARPSWRGEDLASALGATARTLRRDVERLRQFGYTVESDVDLSVFLPVASGSRAEGPLEVLELPERDCLVAHVAGPYTQTLQARESQLTVQRMKAEGLAARQDGTLASKVFNRYLVTPDQAVPEDLATEVCRPLA